MLKLSEGCGTITLVNIEAPTLFNIKMSAILLVLFRNHEI